MTAGRSSTSDASGCGNGAGGTRFSVGGAIAEQTHGRSVFFVSAAIDVQATVPKYVWMPR